MQLSVIIVNYNVKFFLEQCLCSVERACKKIIAEIIVVDNHSTDGSKEYFENRFSNIRFIWNNENTGFASANNQALKFAGGAYVLFLNPDTILPEDCLEKSIAFMDGRKEEGAMGIRMIDGSGKFLPESKRGFPTPFTSLYKLAGLTALFPASRVFARYYLGHLDANSNHQVDVLAGAFMMVSKKVLEVTSGFDERFFMYGEDVDLSYRVQKAGFKNWYFSGSSIIHFKGESTQRGSLNYVRLFYGAMSLFVKKHYNGGIAVFYNLVIRLAIRARALLSGMARLIKTRYLNDKTTTRQGGCFIIARKQEFEWINAILDKNGLKYQNITHPGTQLLPNVYSLNEVQEWKDMLSNKQVSEIIFSINGFAAKEVIALLEHLPEGISCRFHYAGSRSIVASFNKTTAGDCIS